MQNRVSIKQITPERFAVVDQDGNVLDNAAGYGYKSAEKAINGYRYKCDHLDIRESMIGEKETQETARVLSTPFPSIFIRSPEPIKFHTILNDEPSLYVEKKEENKTRRNEKEKQISIRDLFPVSSDFLYEKEKKTEKSAQERTKKRTNKRIEKKENLEMTKKKEEKTEVVPVTEEAEKELSTSEKSAPVQYLNNFVESDKEICVFPLGTGSGKSTAFASFAIDNALNERRSIFITDRVSLVQNQVQEIIKEIKKSKPQLLGELLYIPGNVENISEHIKEIANALYSNPTFKPCITELKKQIKARNHLLKNAEFDDLIEKTDEKIIKAERELKRTLKNYVYAEYPDLLKIKEKADEEHKNDGYQKMYQYMQNHPFLSQVLTWFPSISLMFKKIIVFTMQKSLTKIDTILFGIIDITETHFAQNTNFFFDESDADKDSILDTQIKDAVAFSTDAINALEDMNIAAEKVLQQDVPSYWQESERLKDAVNDFKAKHKVLCEQYYLRHSFVFDETTINEHQFMYFPRDTQIIGNAQGYRRCQQNLDGWKMYLTETNQVCITKDEETDGIPVKEFLIALQDGFISAENMLRQMLNVERKYDQKDLCEHDIATNVIKYASTTDSSSIMYHTLMKLITNEMHIKKSIKTGNIAFYETGFDIISLAKSGDLAVAIQFVTLITTPEKWLLTICRHGGKVILSSATGGMKNIFGNFDLDYEEIQKRMYIMNREETKMLQDYVDSRFEYKEEYKSHVFYHSIDSAPEDVNEIIDELASLLAKAEIKCSPMIDYEHCKENSRNQLVEIYESNKHKPVTEGNNNTTFHCTNIFARMIAVLDAFCNDVRIQLNLAPYNLSTMEVYNGIYEEVKNLFSKTLRKKIRFQELNAKNIEQAIKRVQEHVDNKTFVVIMTSFASSGKGLNLLFKENDEEEFKKCFCLSEHAKHELEQAILKHEGLEVDIDSVAMVNPTYLTPVVTKDDEHQEKTKHMLECIYATESLEASKQISQQQADAQINKLLSLNKLKVTLNGLCPEMTDAKAISVIIQAVGRSGRRGVKRNHVHFYIDKEIQRKHGKGLHNLKAIGLSPEMISLQSPETIMTLDYLQQEEKAVYNDVAVNCCNNSVTEFNGYWRKHQQGDIQAYLKVRDNCFTAELTDNESANIPQEALMMYMPSHFVKNKHGYKVVFKDKEDQNGNGIVENILVLKDNETSPYSVRALREATLCGDYRLRKYLLGLGYCFEEKENAKLIFTPKGFDIGWGKLGEDIVRFYLGQILPYQIISLPEEIDEAADMLIVTKDRIYAIDAKFFNNTVASEREKKKDLKKSFEKKLRCIEEYFQTPTTYLVVNGRPNIDHAQYQSIVTYNDCKDRKYPESRIIGIPNLVDEKSKILPEVYEFLVEETRAFAEREEDAVH